jgi:predicted O-linked N-acetylglucosamine transferase (SPINDLY family)
LDLLISLHKKNIFELYAFSDSNYFDEYTHQLKNHFHSWQHVDHLNDLQLINLIRNHGINILIDMQGHTYGNRLQIFANKPAPVQLSWASYLASTGIPEIDYIIADPYVVPIKEDNNYAEKIWRLPNIWNALSISDINNIGTAQTPAIKNQFITFGCFNNINKINDNVIRVWSNILNKIHGSKLFLKSDKFLIDKIKENFYKKFENYGVNRLNLIFEKNSERYDLLKNYNKIDIALDTFPYSGGTTSLELSWMCVPLLTMIGDRFISRCGESINNNLQMVNWIASDEVDYVNKAIEFTQDIKKLETIRNNLRINSRKSCLFNIDLFSKNFENAINQIWKIYLSK